MFHRRERIYLDYASAPPTLPEALQAMRAAQHFIGNPGAIHREGVEAKRALDDARERIAKLLEVKAGEIIFTSGLTEANNIAIVGAARALEGARRSLSGTHWIVSAVEHSSVLECFAEVERMGGEVMHVLPDSRGIISPESVQKLLRPETVFVSIGWANNEIGTIQPLGKIARVIHQYEENSGSLASATSQTSGNRKVIFHSDAGQAPLYLPSTAHSLGVDLLSLGGNKLYGPHGVGAVFVATGTLLTHVSHGGPQEKNLKPGTENIALAQGFAIAFEIIAKEREAEAKRLEKLRNDFASEILAHIPDVVINGDLKHALPHMLNISIPLSTSDVVTTTEYLTLALDAKGIALSTKSACREGEESRSHVVEAIAQEQWRAQNTLRFSLGRDTKEGDLKRVVDELAALVTKR